MQADTSAAAAEGQRQQSQRDPLLSFLSLFIPFECLPSSSFLLLPFSSFLTSSFNCYLWLRTPSPSLTHSLSYIIVVVFVFVTVVP